MRPSVEANGKAMLTTAALFIVLAVFGGMLWLSNMGGK
jgi:hypothetical protein